MAGQEWRDWFEREELIGQISDIRVQNLQVEREVVQKRTFTRWMNLHLEKCNPPLVVQDLFRDIRDGRVLMALLEELSGSRLLHEFKPSSHRIFRLNNIARVLTFLEERNVKLVSIDAADVADGNSSIVLGLIWNIILFFQIKELTGNIRNQFPSSSSLSSIPTSSDSDVSQSSTPSDERKPSVAPREHGRAIKTLLHWVQRRTRKYGVMVQDFGKSWTSGLAFLAIIKSIDPSLVDMRRALLRSPRENIEEAFRTAHYSLGIPRLLEPEDVTLNPPDQQSIMTYVSQFLEHFPGIEEDEPSDFLERNKVSPRATEPPFRNGVPRKREKPSAVKKDWVQPPPKIFISSVVEDPGRKRPPVMVKVAEDRPWESEDSSVGSSPSTTESRPLCKPLGLSKEPPSNSSSPQPSPIDSAVDSWAETPSELNQSCSAGSLGDSTSAGELTSLESPLESERVFQEMEALIDEGNFSLSMDTRSTLLSEEEDAYRYILDLKEEEPTSNPPHVDLKNDPVDHPESGKPLFSDSGDCDSGYYPGHKDQVDGGSKFSPIPDSEEQLAGDENATKTKALEPSAAQEVSREPEQMTFFDDDPEYHVVRYERISISGSEEDIEELCAELDNEASYKDVTSFAFDADMSGDRYCEEDAVEPPALKEIDEIEQILQEPSLEPEPEDEAGLDYTELELSQIFTNQAGVVQTEAEMQDDNQFEAELEVPQVPTNTSQSGTQETEAEIQDDQICSPTEVPQISTNTTKSGDQESEAEIQDDNQIHSTTEVPQVPKDTSQSANQETEVEIQNDQIYITTEVPQISTSISQSEKHKNKDEIQDDEICTTTEVPQVLANTIGSLNQETESESEDHDNVCSPTEVPQVLINTVQSGNQETGSEIEDNEICTKMKLPETSTNIKSETAEVQGTAGQTSGMETSDRSEEAATKDLRPFSDAMTAEEQRNQPREVLKVGEQIMLEQASQPEGEPWLEGTSVKDLDVVGGTEILHGFPASEPVDGPAAKEDKQTASPQTASFVDQPYDRQDEGQATWDDLDRIQGPERAERYRAELRLSLSVTPLQPAPAQPGSDSDGERTSQDKVDEGGVESPMQSPFGLWVSHPGEWGVAESDLDPDLSELNRRNKKLDPLSAPSKEKRVTPSPKKEEAISERTEEKSEPSPAPSVPVPEPPEPKEEKPKEVKNGEAPAPVMSHGPDESACVMCNKKVGSCRQRSEVTHESAFTDMDLLLLLWLLVFCLLVFPQMDLWSLPRLLLNLDK